MKLNYTQSGSGEPLIIIHGLFGSANNFKTLVKRFSESFTVYCVDLRNHGLSPHDDDVSIPAMGDDIIEFMDDLDIDKAHILGHSLGGKVAMQAAMNNPDRILKLIIADVAPVVYENRFQK